MSHKSLVFIVLIGIMPSIVSMDHKFVEELSAVEKSRQAAAEVYKSKTIAEWIAFIRQEAEKVAQLDLQHDTLYRDTVQKLRYCCDIPWYDKESPANYGDVVELRRSFAKWVAGHIRAALTDDKTANMLRLRYSTLLPALLAKEAQAKADLSALVAQPFLSVDGFDNRASLQLKEVFTLLDPIDAVLLHVLREEKLHAENVRQLLPRLRISVQWVDATTQQINGYLSHFGGGFLINDDSDLARVDNRLVIAGNHLHFLREDIKAAQQLLEILDIEFLSYENFHANLYQLFG